ncbi:hypothetical protein KNHN1_07830 [Pseudomonas guariconensis]
MWIRQRQPLQQPLPPGPGRDARGLPGGLLRLSNERTFAGRISTRSMFRRFAKADLQQKIYFLKGLDFVSPLADFRVKRRRNSKGLKGLGASLASKLNKD